MPLLDIYLILFVITMLAFGIVSIVDLVIDWYEHGGADGWNKREW